MIFRPCAAVNSVHGHPDLPGADVDDAGRAPHANRRESVRPRVDPDHRPVVARGPDLVVAAVPAAAAPQSSVVVATTPNTETFPITADRDHVPIKTADLEFRLVPLPADADLASCALRLVLAEGVPRGDDSGVLLQLLDAAVPPERARPIAAIRVPAGTPKDTAVILRSRDLCAALRAASRSLRIRHETGIRWGASSPRLSSCWPG